MNVLPFRRPVRRFARPRYNPAACHHLIHHPRTAEERALVKDGITLARIDGNEDLVVYLQAQLDTAERCDAQAPLCPCGCGRKWSEHSEPMGAA